MFRLFVVLARAAKPRRRWLQFSVGTLLLVITACAVVLGIVTERARDQRALINDIKRLGGRVSLTHEMNGEGEGNTQADQQARRSLLARWLGDDYADIGSIEIQGRTLSDELFSRICRLTQLRNASWLGTQFTDRRLFEMRSLTRLRELHIKGSPVTDVGLAGVARMRDLRSVTLSNTRVRGPGLVHLSDKTAIEDLSLRCCPLQDEGLDHLQGLTALTGLDLGYTDVTDRGLARLAQLDQLTSLDLSGTKITDAGLVHLAGLTNLQYLHLSQTAITGSGFAHLAGLRNLAGLDLNGTQVDDAGLAQLAKLPKLEVLSLGGAPLTGASLSAPGGFPALNHLSLDGTNVNDDAAASLAALPALRMLDLSHTRVGDRVAGRLARLPKLRVLRATETRIGDAGAAALATAPSLQSLSLDKCDVGDAGLAALGASQTLSELDLRDSLVTDAGLDQITARKMKLQLTGTSITELAIDRFEPRLPGFPGLRWTWFARARQGRSAQPADIAPLAAIGEADTAEALWERAATLSLAGEEVRRRSSLYPRGVPAAELFAAAVSRSSRPAPIFVAWGDLAAPRPDLFFDLDAAPNQDLDVHARQAVEAHLEGHPERELLEYVLERGGPQMLCYAAAGALEPEYGAAWQRLADSVRWFADPRLPLDAFVRRDPHNALAHYYRAEGLRETATLEELLEWLQAGHDAPRVEGYPTPLPPGMFERPREPARLDEPWIDLYSIKNPLDDGYRDLPWADRAPWNTALWTAPNSERRLKLSMAKMFERLRDGAVSQGASAWPIIGKFGFCFASGDQGRKVDGNKRQDHITRYLALMDRDPTRRFGGSAAPLRALLPEILAAQRAAAAEEQRELAKHGFDGPLDWLADLEE